MVMPRMTSRTSSRRFTLLKLASAETDRVFADALTRSQSRRCGGIQRIVFARQAHLQFRPKLAVAPNLPSGLAVRVAQIANLPVGFGSKP